MAPVAGIQRLRSNESTQSAKESWEETFTKFRRLGSTLDARSPLFSLRLT